MWGGGYYTWTSDDNKYKSTAIEEMVKFLDKNPEIDLVSFNFNFINEDGSYCKKARDIDSLENQRNLAFYSNIGACFMYRKEIAEEVGEYDTKMFCTEDYDYWCRIALNGKISYQDKVLYDYRKNSQSLTATKKEIILKKTNEIRKKYAVKILERCELSKEDILKLFLSKNFYPCELYLELAKNLDRNYVKKFQRKEKLKNFIKSIFSIENITSNSKKYKAISFLGIKVKFRKDSHSFINISDILSFLKFKYVKSISQKYKPKVLIIEPNSYHGEILPGFVKYFQDLGYSVDLLLRDKNVNDNPLINIKNINVYKCGLKCIKTILKLKKICQYDFIFFSSSALWDINKPKTSFLDYLQFIPKSKKGLLMVEHNIYPYLIEYNEQKYLEYNRLFTLSGFDNTPMLNPHYFVDIESNHIKNVKTKFIVSGHFLKGTELLIETVNKLRKNNITNFEIRVLGSEISVPKELKKYFNALGYVKFKTLYKELDKADFILPMLDEFDENHKHYLNGTTSGSRQQSLGFLKPLLINEKFATVYNFDNSNSIIYKKNDLYEAMKEAISMNQDDYTQIQKSLKLLADDIYNKSLENLRKAVDR